MHLIIGLLPLVIILALYASYIKLAAKILPDIKVNWKDCFLFSMVILIFTLLGNVGFKLSGLSLPLIFGLIFGPIVHMVLGSWFFRKRATNAQGEFIGRQGGVYLIAITLVFFGITIAALFGLAHVIGLRA